jgi:hypothetical protein
MPEFRRCWWFVGVELDVGKSDLGHAPEVFESSYFSIPHAGFALGKNYLFDNSS